MDMWKIQTPNLVFSKTLEKAEWHATIKKEVDADEIQKLEAMSESWICSKFSDF